MGALAPDRLRKGERQGGMRDKSETLRRLRLGDLRRLLHSRYGPVLPDDDAGRADLGELLLPVSLGPTPARIMANVIEVWAPWLPKPEEKALIARILAMPKRARRPTGRALGKRLNLSNAERERFRLWTIAPADMTDVQMAEQRRAKERLRQRRRRRKLGTQRRAEWLAARLTKQKPWEAIGISRPTWYRRRNKGPKGYLLNVAHQAIER
jgi:hypothetical protein